MAALGGDIQEGLRVHLLPHTRGVIRQRRGCLNHHRFRLLTYLEREILLDGDADYDFGAAEGRLEPLCRNTQLIRARRKVRQHVTPRIAGRSGTRRVRRGARRSDRRPGHSRPGRIRDRAGDLTGDDLRGHGDRSEKKEEKSTAYEYKNTLEHWPPHPQI